MFFAPLHESAYLERQAAPTGAEGEKLTGFEFLFSFYSLLLGLAVARVATGLADNWGMRAKTSFGVSTLLLGILVLLSVAQQWLSFWGARNVLTMGPWEVLTCMGMSLPYIFISQAMFPQANENCTDLDAHYLQNSRSLLLALLVPPTVSLAYNVAVQGFNWGYAINYVLPLVVPIALVFSMRRWLHRAGLSLLVVHVLVLMFA
jgi:hypothetical protein